MLARFERLMEQAVEGSLRRVFPAHLQPVQLAKAAARAMEASQVVGLRGVEVPNVYVLRVAPDDLARFADYNATLSRELSQYLVAYARDRRLRPVGTPRVELLEDTAVRLGTVRADARFVDVAPERRAALEEALEGTRRLMLDQARSAPPAPTFDGRLSLVDPLGPRQPLDPDAGVIRIGRSADNDLTIRNQRVSRYHVQLRWIDGRWLVYDLESTNGTFVDGEPVGADQPLALHAGAQLRLGDHDLSVEPDEVAADLAG